MNLADTANSQMMQPPGLMAKRPSRPMPTFSGSLPQMSQPPMQAGYGQIGAGDAGMAGKMPPPMQAGYGQIGQQDGGGMSTGIHPIQQAATMMMQNGVHPSYIQPILQAHGLQPMN